MASPVTKRAVIWQPTSARAAMRYCPIGDIAQAVNNTTNWKREGKAMVAIEVKYIGPTNYRGSRYKAYTCNGQKLTLPNNDALDPEDNAEAVAHALKDKMGWKGELRGGGTVKGWAFVFV